MDHSYDLPDNVFFIYVLRHYKHQATAYDYYNNTDCSRPLEAKAYQESELLTLIEHLDASKKKFPNDVFSVKAIRNKHMSNRNTNVIRKQLGLPLIDEKTKHNRIEERELQNKDMAKQLNYELAVYRRTYLTDQFYWINFEINNLMRLKEQKGTIFKMSDYKQIIDTITKWRNEFPTHAYKICYRPSLKTKWKLFEMFEPKTVEDNEALKEEKSSERQ